MGCIASAEAADIYGLTELAASIQNSEGNSTRFVVVATQPVVNAACDKTSIVFMVEHRPGSLHDVLQLFSDGGVNIHKLESRPLKDRPFEYLFHLDFEGSVADPQVARRAGQSSRQIRRTHLAGFIPAHGAVRELWLKPD